MTPSQVFFQENNNEKCKNTTAWLSKHECYKAHNGHNIKLWKFICRHLRVSAADTVCLKEIE